MKRITLTVAMTLVFGVVAARAEHPINTPLAETRTFSTEQLELIEDNLIVALESNIPGLRATAALTLRQVKEISPEYSFSRSVIPLMRIVGTEDFDATSRVAAGLALHDLRSERGDYRIKWAGKFTENPKLKHLYEWLAYYRTQEKSSL
jgi:hypothetical protein